MQLWQVFYCLHQHQSYLLLLLAPRLDQPFKFYMAENPSFEGPVGNLPQVAIESSRGATITTVYTGRQVKVLVVLETEIDSLAMFNTLTTLSISVGISLISLAVGIWATGGFSKELTPEGYVLSHFVGPSLCALGVLVFLFAYLSHRKLKATLNAIRSASQPPV